MKIEKTDADDYLLTFICFPKFRFSDQRKTEQW